MAREIPGNLSKDSVWGAAPHIDTGEEVRQEADPSISQTGKGVAGPECQAHWVRWFRTLLRDNVLVCLTFILGGQIFS